MNLSNPQDSDPQTTISPSKTDKDTIWLLKQLMILAVIIGVIFLVEYVVRHFTLEKALDRLYDEGVVTTGELTEQHLTVRTGGRGSSSASFTYYFKIDGNSMYFESTRTPPNTDIFSNKRSTFPVTYLPDDYNVHLFGDVKQGTADDESVQYHGKGIVTILGVISLGVVVLAGIGLVIGLMVWYWTVSDSRRAANSNTPQRG